MRIYKRLPFAQPNGVKVNSCVAECERFETTISDLQRIRKHITDGTMTRSLYDFINMDGSFDELLFGLPKPSDTVTCESLAYTQTQCIDEAIEGIAEKWKVTKTAMWEAIKEWFLDWFDVNRYIKYDLQRNEAAYQSNPSTFGNINTFGRIVIRAYHKPYWEDMIGACEKMNAILASMPAQLDKLDGWIKANLVSIQTCLKPFGHSVVQPGPRLIHGNAVHDKVLTSLDSARWRFNLLGRDMQRCIKCLSDQIAGQKLFNTMERLFAASEVMDRLNLHFIRSLVMVSKANTFVVARGLKNVVNAARGRRKLPA